jgi:hypothetical protein
MNIQKSLLQQYKYIEKEKDWKDDNSYLNQKIMAGGLPVNNVLKHPQKQLENLALPVGLINVPPEKSNYYGGSASIKKVDTSILNPQYVEDKEYDSIIKHIIAINKGEYTYVNKRKTHKKK